MARKMGASIGHLILQAALGFMLAVTGIWTLQGGGNAAAESLRQIFDGDMEKVVVIIFGVIELLLGIFLVVEIFIGNRFGVFGRILEIIVIIVWAFAIILMDFLGGNLLKPNFLNWLYTLSIHCAILGGLLYIHD